MKDACLAKFRNWSDIFCLSYLCACLYSYVQNPKHQRSHEESLAFNPALSTPHSSAARPILRRQPHCLRRLLLCWLLRCFYPCCCRRRCCREIDPCFFSFFLFLIVCKAKQLTNQSNHPRRPSLDELGCPSEFSYFTGEHHLLIYLLTWKEQRKSSSSDELRTLILFHYRKGNIFLQQ